ncbi:uncharacterized protein AB675_3772 [Cyphellophora attinorum]|uniref:DUF1772-domain-containing protein n=1 Tax=Cyphellophora attinorum TaxID=1664694 RepID=A0A0N1NY07_9EURO|nr:uncharacterized protein AB675_3772 [Phialophora attinorum]KPI35265.1 hypothetical protein AB675_3772 [Phialophora attinorum]
MSANATALATAIGVASSSAFLSCGLTLSYLSIPSILLPAPPNTTPAQTKSLHDSAARSWQYLYDVGKKVGPAIGTVGAAAYIYAARNFPSAAKTERQLLYAAAVMNMLVGPFTIVVMARTNTEIYRRADAAKVGEDERVARKGKGSIEGIETPELLKRWARLNAWRCVFPVVALALAGRVLLAL